ncbi:MAG: HAMP domain-containing histidine kinase [Lachnospiraceae bacterium]|nr:HAMP domain-containing histidine kinase [Lachnospiraceae bacterium]
MTEFPGKSPYYARISSYLSACLRRLHEWRNRKNAAHTNSAHSSAAHSNGAKDAVLGKLHQRLTAVCVATTGLILAVLTVICLLISQSEIRSQEYASFLSGLNTMYQNLQQQTSLSHTWIRQMEQNYQCSIRILDNGESLFFQTLSEDEATESMMAQAKEEALSLGLDLDSTSSSATLTRHLEFTMKVRGDNYGSPQSKICYVSAALVPRSGGVLAVLVVHSLSSMHRRIVRQGLPFLLADLAAWLLLSIFFWHFTARVLRPIWENRRKQVQFIAAASHELRSPLTVILSNAAAVRGGVLPFDMHFLDTVDAEGNRMSHLISDMLQLAGADNETWSIAPAEIELDTLLLQVWEDFDAQAHSRHLHWDIRLPEEPLPCCVCDAERIRQLLGILIDNAFSYTPEGGQVCLALSASSVSAQSPVASKHTRRSIAAASRHSRYNPATSNHSRRSIAAASRHSRHNPAALNHSRRSMAASELSQPSGNTFLIQVIDNGPGIPDAEKEAVFERFHRLDPSRKDKTHFGLGLCIAREIVRLHHGTLTVSDTPGGGTTFTVTLPG